MTTRIADILAQRPAEVLFGRQRELAALMRLASAERPVVLHVHGIPGIGKSALMQHAGRRAEDAGVAVIALDCGAIEPTEPGFLQALAAATGCALPDVNSAAARIGALAPRVLLMLDQYDQFRLMDVWLHQTFIPLLPHNVRLTTFSRQPPAPQWLTAPEWRQLLAGLRLEPLAAADAEALLADAGLTNADARRLAAAGYGHPLALHMAARARLERPDRDLGDLDVSQVTTELARMALADIAAPVTRRAVEAASLVRRVTEPLLAAMFPDDDAQRLSACLRSLPIVEQRHDGLAVHGAIRHAIAAALRAADPERARDIRATAWRHLRARIGQAPVAELWRNTADAIYLLENPVVRDAFFPNAPQSLTVAPARAADGDAIMDVVRRHDGAAAAQHLGAWWSRHRAAFRTIENADRSIAGFYCMLPLDQVDPFLLVEDPVTAHWWRHVRDNPVARGDKVLLLRRWLSTDDGEPPSAVQAACWLDIKRTYLEMRPALRRVYLALHDMAPYEPVAGRLGFVPIDGAVMLDDRPHHSAMLDFGPCSVDGWISGLLGAELGQDAVADPSGPLDSGARELVLDRERIALTQKEFALLAYLHARADRAVSRDELLADVWGWKVDGGSNVVDALVRALRRKLGPRATIIETVRGVGYRSRIPAG